jgi:MarR family 2-MHQ and catechol resistance regulon transcriptional repressor
VKNELAIGPVLDRNAYPGAQKDALKLWVVLARCYSSFAQAEAARSKHEELTQPQFGVLEALAHLGPMKMCDLGGKLLMSGANLTGVIDRLETKGLVRRVMNTGDRRTYIIHLTETGGKRIAKIFSRHAKVIEELTSSLTSVEKRALTSLLKKLGKSIHSSI